MTGTALGWEEHAITQVLTGMGLDDRWRVAEHFAEYGALRRAAVERQTRGLIDAGAAPRFGGYRVVAVGDTGCHRTSRRAWGVCTSHEPAGRRPDRASTVPAHNGVVAGDLAPGAPWTYPPHTPRPDFRVTRLPAGEVFATETSLAPAMLRQAAADPPAPAVFDGAYANAAGTGPCLGPVNGRRIDVVTRLRFDARRYCPLDPPPGRRGGRPRKWGGRLPAPQPHDRSGVPWQDGAAYLYGRRRGFRVEELPCRWSGTGPGEPVRVSAVGAAGYDEAWLPVTTSATRTAVEVVAVFAARSRQEDGPRGHEQRLGVEGCRAWAEAPVEPTFAVQVAARTRLRLLAGRLDADPGAGRWWSPPDWSRHKSHPSLRDVGRVVWAPRAEFSNLLRGLDGVRECDAAPSYREGPAA